MATQPDGRLQNGGRRPGAGRPAGTPYRRLQDVLSLRERFPIWPIEYFLTVLNAPDIKVPKHPPVNENLRERYHKQVAAAAAQRAEKMEAARNAAPFLHPKLASIDVTTKPQVRHKLDLTKLSDEELAQLEHITAKAQFSVITDNDDDPLNMP